MESFAIRPLELTAIVGFLSLVLFLFLIRRRSATTNNPKLPPEAAGKWPVIGHLHLLRGSDQLPHVTLAKLADIYGPIFTIDIGVRRSVVISSSEIAQECFTTNDLAVSARPKLIGAEILGWNYASFSFSPFDSYYRKIRKIVTTNLLSNQRLSQLRHVRESEAERLVKDLYNLWKKREDDQEWVSVELSKWIGDLSLNVILQVVAGKRFSFGGDGDGGEEAARFRRVSREFFRLIGLFLVGDAIPSLRWLDLGGHEKAMKRTLKELNSIADEWLEEHRRRRKDSGGGDDERDFMDVMMTILESSDVDFEGLDADYVNRATTMSIITSGIDTTTVTIVWALCLVLTNPDVLKNLQDELDLHVGKERLVNESDVSNLTYLHAVVKETLRLYPPGPLSGPREFSEDCTIGGYHVPKGTRLITNLWKIQTDPILWPDPLEFRAERFLTANRDVDVKGQHFELIPFGAGRRSCPGITYGLQMTYLVLASLLQAFDVSVSGHVDMTASFGLTNSKATPLNVLIKPRLCMPY